MRLTRSLILFTLAVFLFGCAPLGVAQPAPTAGSTPQATSPVSPTSLPSPTPLPTTPAWKSYENSDFGLRFQYPPDWFGPEAYTADRTLRLEIGSDTVYPYGTGLEKRHYTRKNAYFIVIQYARNDQNSYWRETYDALLNLRDGEAQTGVRGKLIRLRELDLGLFRGIEYIATLSETAQTEPVYSREVLLFDDQSNVLTLSGMPNNVELANSSYWRTAYQQVDQAYQALFYQVLESILLQ